MSFDGHPSVFYLYFRGVKASRRTIFRDVQGIRRKKITFSFYKIDNVTTVPSNPATAYCFVTTTCRIKWGKNDSDELNSPLAHSKPGNKGLSTNRESVQKFKDAPYDF